MAMHPSMSYTPYSKSSRENTGNIITFAQFEEGNLFFGARDDTESGIKYDDDNTMSPLIG